MRAPLATPAWSLRATPAEWLAFATAVAVFAYVGWDGALWDPRFGLLLHLFGVGAITGLGLLALRGGAIPRTALDLPILLLLAAFALATLSAANLGMSLRALATIAAYALCLPIALVCVRARPAWVGAATAIPVLGLSVISLVLMLVRRAEWVIADGPGLPPIRFAAEGTPFGSVAVPPFVIWPAWALAALIEPAPLRRAVRVGLVVTGVPLTILSGSRSAWLAMAITVLAAAVPWVWHRRARLVPRQWTPRTVGLAAAGVIGLALVLIVVAPRLTAVTSLLYRASLWRDTLLAWATDPLLGIGPGFMPYARLAAAPDYTFPVRQPHSHNLPLGVLGDAGIVGLLAAVALVAVAAWAAGPWRARTATGRVAGFVLLGLLAGGLFEDLTFIPGFNLLAIALLAVALTDAGAVRWRPVARTRWTLAPALASGALLLGVAIVADAGAIAYRAGTDAAAQGDWVRAAERLGRAVEIDPWHPGGPKALAVAAERSGDFRLARSAAEDAAIANPGDAPSWVNLAWLCREAGDTACQERAAGRAVATAGFGEAELLNAAWLFEDLGMTDQADDAYRRSLLSQRLTVFDGEWPRDLEIGETELAEDFGALDEFNRLLARHAMGEPFSPEEIEDPATRALAHAMLDQREEADAWIARAIDAAPDNVVTWDIALAVRNAWGRDVSRELAIAAVVRGRDVPSRGQTPGVPNLTFDIGSFRAYPSDGLVDPAHRLGTSPPFPWIMETLLP